MRLIKAEITGFGQYRQQQFDFLVGNQLFFGINEAGKSTLYQFIQAMLFGFPKKSARKRDYTPLDGAAYGGKLWLSIEPYEEVRIERFRQMNRGKASVWVGEEERDEAFLIRLLSPLSQDVFQDVFTFQQEQLSEVSRLQEKELHAALISLGISGSKQLMARIQSYQKNNQQLFKPRGQRLPLNQRLKEWQQLKETILQKETQEKDVQQAYQRVAKSLDQQKQLREQLSKLQQQQQQLNQQKINWSLYEEWQELRTLKESDISDEEQQQLRMFYQEYQQLSEEIRKKEEELSRLEQGQETDRYFFYLDQEAAIQALLRQEVAIARLIDEQERLLAEQQATDQELTQLSKHWGWQRETPPVLDKQIYRLLDQLEDLEQQSVQQKSRIQWLEEKIQPLEAEVLQLEKKLPALGKQLKPGIGLSIAGVGIFLLLVSFLLPMPLKGWLLGLGSAGIVVGAGVFLFAGSKTSGQNKMLWQEKSLQLDQLKAEIATETEQVLRTQQEKEQLINYLQPFFGNDPDYLSWRQMIHDYQLAAEKFHQKLASFQELQQKEAVNRKSIAAIDQQFELLADWLPLSNKAIVEKLALVSRFTTEMQEIKLTRLQQPSTLLAQQLKKSKENRDELFEHFGQLLERFGLSHPTEVPTWIKQWEQQQKQVERKVELTQLLTPVFPESISWEMLAGRLAENEQQQETLQQRISELSEEKQRSQLQIEQLQIDGVLDELYQEESRLLSEIEELAITWSTNQVLAAFLSDLATELSEQQLPQLLQRASYYFKTLTKGRYQAVRLLDGILHVTSQETLLDIYTLSTGTKDQLIMAVRFAYLSLQEQAVSPVIIDDGWLHYDSERKEQLAKLFAEFGQKHQVICLSSDQEMVSYYQRLHQPVVEIMQRM